VKDVKDSKDWACDICCESFAEKYGVDYAEARHKKPISTYEKPKKHS